MKIRTLHRIGSRNLDMAVAGDFKRRNKNNFWYVQ